eukprot:TRINITY_DN41736_c0_g6_i1.p1 TRINITY_DN41736_c0_g6~~TRINITY_DN41736_c0_g6_i1.p1  ORF type:complete len:880 (-),score=187.98 TRINITY_DN41736_c0_g6_i1:168-2807(-)
MSNVPVVQFAQDIVFTAETCTEDGPLQLRVVRIGPTDRECSVNWAVDDSPLAGKKFELDSGTLHFKPGQKVHDVHVTILGDDHFDTIVEVSLTLSSPQGCVLGDYLYKTRVKIIDDDVFPTNQFRDLVKEDPSCKSWRDMHNWPMFIQYCKFNWHQVPGSRKKLLKELFDSLIFVASLLINKELVNYLAESYNTVVDLRIAAGDPELDVDIALAPVVGYGLALFVPYFVQYYLDYRANFWGIGGGSRKTLQENLLRKYLNADEYVRSTTTRAEILKALTIDSPELVKDGYVKALDMMTGLTRFGFCGVLQLWFCNRAQVDNPATAWILWLALLPPLFVPTTIMLFLKKRYKKTKDGLFREEMVLKLLLQELTDNLGNFRTVADYYQRPLIIEKVKEEIDEYNKIKVFNAAVKTNNIAFLEWLDKMVQLAWVIFGGWKVCKAQVDLGTFLATMAIFKSNSDQISKMYVLFLTIQASFSKMWNVVKYMNFPTDLNQRMVLDNNRLRKSHALLSGSKEGVRDEGPVDFDTMKIELRNVTYVYPMAENLKSLHPTKPAVSELDLVVKQGQLVAVFGKANSGRGTLLRLCGGVLLPTSGSVFIPSHLRMLHVDKEAQVFDESIAFNVFFGCFDGKARRKPKHLPRAILERGWKICEMLDFPPTLLEKAKDTEAEEDGFQMSLSASQIKRIHLARAFIYNPEVLILNVPTSAFDKATQSGCIMGSLRQFVTQKGLAMDMLPGQAAASSDTVRPRTCIFTTGDEEETKFADYVHPLSDYGGASKGMMPGGMDVNRESPYKSVFSSGGNKNQSELVVVPEDVVMQERGHGGNGTGASVIPVTPRKPLLAAEEMSSKADPDEDDNTLEIPISTPITLLSEEFKVPAVL